MSISSLTKSVAVFFLLTTFSVPVNAQQKTSATPYLQLSSVIQNGYKGWVKEATIKVYERAVQKNGQWVPEEETYEKTVYHFDKQGELTHYDMYLAGNENEHYTGKVVYSRKTDTSKAEQYDHKDQLVGTIVFAGNDPLGYSTWTYNSLHQLKEYDVYILDSQFQTSNNTTVFYDSAGKITGERNIRRTHLYENGVQKVTAIVAYKGYKETDTVITRNTILEKDKKGNEIITLRKQAGQPHHMLFYHSFVFYDE